MNTKPPLRTELNIYGNDGFRMSLPLSDEDAKTFFSQSKNGVYEGELRIWATVSTDFKTEEEREDFYKNYEK